MSKEEWLSSFGYFRDTPGKHDDLTKDNEGFTPLHSAAVNGHYDTCDVILKNTENKNPSDDFGITPLDLADHEGHAEICKLIKK